MCEEDNTRKIILYILIVYKIEHYLQVYYTILLMNF